MRKSTYLIVKGLFVVLVIIIVLHIVASVLFDDPMVFSFALENISDDDDVVSFLNKKNKFLKADFQYIGYSTHDIHSPDTPILFFWHTSPLPIYISVGTDAYILSLAHFDSVRNEFDYVNIYIGSSRAIDGVVRRYSYSFNRVD